MNTRQGLAVAAVAIAGFAALMRAQRAPEPAPAVKIAATVAARSGPNTSGAVVFVAGEVVQPGVYRLPPGARIEAAVRAAGGVKAGADPVAVNFAEPLRDGEEIVVPAIGRTPAAHAANANRLPRPRAHRSGRSRAPSANRAAAPSRKAPPLEPVDLNLADAAQLESLPGIGARLAERIVAFREANGPFAALDELLDVNGVGERLLEAIAPYVTVGR